MRALFVYDVETQIPEKVGINNTDYQFITFINTYQNVSQNLSNIFTIYVDYLEATFLDILNEYEKSQIKNRTDKSVIKYQSVSQLTS